MGPVLAHAHDPGLVMLSIIMAILAAYTALELAGRVTAARGRTRFSWLTGGAVAMGLGIWSMHFTAMLAFKLPIPVRYDVVTVLVSLLVAIGASGLALFIVSRRVMTRLQLVVGGSIMGAAIAAMHYIGMAAMRLEATVQYDPSLFSLSIIIAVSASMAALWLAFQLREATTGRGKWQKVGSAVVMGAAIAGMHYTGMAAAIFRSSERPVGALSGTIDISALGSGAIAAGALIVLGLALLLALVDQRLATQAADLVERELHHTSVLERVNKELEARVADLRLVTKISRTMASILEQKELVQEVVEQIRVAFNYYHVQVYVFDEAEEKLVVVGGTGEAGQVMVANGYSLDRGQGIVGRVAETKRGWLVANVAEQAEWRPNPLLPETRSEVAVPVRFGEKVLGVLDVQHERIDGLQEADQELMELIANQLAAGLRNARLFEEVEAALAQAQQMQERLVETAWEKGQGGLWGGAYHYSRPEAPVLAEVGLNEVKEQALELAGPTLVRLEGGRVQRIEKGTDGGHEGREGHEGGQRIGKGTDGEVAIVAPVSIRKMRVGAVQLYPARPEQGWSEDELAIVEAVVTELGQMTESLRLFEETRWRANQERMIRDISQKLRQAPNLQILAETAAQELSQALGAAHGVVSLALNPLSDEKLEVKD